MLSPRPLLQQPHHLPVPLVHRAALVPIPVASGVAEAMVVVVVVGVLRGLQSHVGERVRVHHVRARIVSLQR